MNFSKQEASWRTRLVSQILLDYQDRDHFQIDHLRLIRHVKMLATFKQWTSPWTPMTTIAPELLMILVCGLLVSVVGLPFSTRIPEVSAPSSNYLGRSRST